MIKATRLTCIAFLSWLGITPASAAPDDPVWRLGESGGKANLTFMVPGSDEVELTFDCRIKTGKVHFFVGSTDPLKPKQALKGSFTAGKTVSTFAGRTVPNELSGSSSFEGSIASDAAIFDAFAANSSLEIRIGSSAQKLSLKTAGNQATKFASRCAKKP